MKLDPPPVARFTRNSVFCKIHHTTRVLRWELTRVHRQKAHKSNKAPYVSISRTGVSLTFFIAQHLLGSFSFIWLACTLLKWLRAWEAIFLSASNLDWGYISLWKRCRMMNFRNRRKRGKNKTEANGSINRANMSSSCVRRKEQMLSLRIYRAGVVKNLWKLEGNKWLKCSHRLTDRSHFLSSTRCTT